MKVLNEDLVYLGTKAFLKSHGWILLGGQPPDGCDNLPVVEVKCPNRTGIGSKGAYKPDLITYRDGVFLIIECKPEHNDADADKLHSILNDDARISLFYDEMKQRKLFERRGIDCDLAQFRMGLKGALAHSGLPYKQQDLIVLLIRDDEGHGTVIMPAIKDDKLQDAFDMS